MANDEEIIKTLEGFIQTAPILLFMKGDPDQPQCGFSARAIECLSECGQEFSFIDILEQPDARRLLPGISDWPTFPQLFISGELIGGSDIISQLHESGELKTMTVAARSTQESS